MQLKGCIMTTVDLARIERKALIRAPRSRVWQAITDIRQFSVWFGVQTEGAFQPGARLRMVSTHEGHEGIVFHMTVDEIQPERRFSWRWHPGAVEPAADSGEPTTLVEFLLDEVEGGTMVTLIESGFDRISIERRAAAYQDNSKGWDFQMNSLAEYVGKTA